MKSFLLYPLLLCSFFCNAQYYTSNFNREVTLTDIQNDPYDVKYWGIFGGYFNYLGQQYGGIVYHHPTKMEWELSLGSNSRLEASIFIINWESQVRKSPFVIGGKSRTKHKWVKTPNAPNKATYQPKTITILESVDLPLYFLHSIGFHGGVSHGNVQYELDDPENKITLNTSAMQLGLAFQFTYNSHAILDAKEVIYNRQITHLSADYIRYFNTSIPTTEALSPDAVANILADLPEEGFRIMCKNYRWYNKNVFTTYKIGYITPLSNTKFSKWIAGIGLGYAF